MFKYYFSHFGGDFFGIDYDGAEALVQRVVRSLAFRPRVFLLEVRVVLRGDHILRHAARVVVAGVAQHGAPGVCVCNGKVFFLRDFIFKKTLFEKLQY